MGTYEAFYAYSAAPVTYRDDWEWDERERPGASVETAGGELRVRLPSGAFLPVMTRDEHQYLTERVGLYDEHNKLTNISDLQDLDRVLVMEMMVFRWGVWCAQGTDYLYNQIDALVYQREINNYSTELRQLKKMLGIDKPARDRQRGEGSVAHYWASLLERAKAFGIMRNKQVDKALELTNQLIGLMTFHDNATPEERAEFHNTAEDILDWIRTVLTPEFQSIDAEFRANEQRYWIRQQ